MDERQVLAKIADGETAYGLLYDADPALIRRFRRTTTTMKNLIDDVRRYFPDAEYYTASGGFNLLLGSSHSEKGRPQQDLHAVGSSNGLVVGDGDY